MSKKLQSLPIHNQSLQHNPYGSKEDLTPSKSKITIENKNPIEKKKSL